MLELLFAVSYVIGTAYLCNGPIMSLLEPSSFIKGFLLGILLVIYKFIRFLSSIVISCAVRYKLRQAKLVCGSPVTKQ